MTDRKEQRRRIERLEWRMGQCVGHMQGRGRFEDTWRKLYHLLADTYLAELHDD